MVDLNAWIKDCSSLAAELDRARVALAANNSAFAEMHAAFTAEQESHARTREQLAAASKERDVLKAKYDPEIKAAEVAAKKQRAKDLRAEANALDPV